MRSDGCPVNLPPHDTDSVISLNLLLFLLSILSFDSEKWINVPACEKISSTSCDVTSLKAVDELGCVKLRIQAERRGLKSSQVEACSNHSEKPTPAPRIKNLCFVFLWVCMY